MKKTTISVTKRDSVPKIVEKILENSEKEITLSISSASVLKDSLSDLELVKREAEAAGKLISIESDDDEILEMAGKAGISVHGEPGSKFVSDIVTVKHRGRKAEEDDSPKHGKTLKIEDPDVHHAESFWDKAREEVDAKKRFAEEIGRPLEEPEKEEREEHVRKHHRRPKFRKVYAYMAGVLAVCAAAFWITGTFFGRADVSLTFKTAPWQYNGTITVSKTFSQVDSSKNYLPGEVFAQQKNVTRIFPASGSANVSQKATAMIFIYNAYSSSNQTLVATTRFVTPDGKIFRLDKAVVVPGADVKNGKITPSSIEAAVTADKPGADYNVGPFDKLTIPGFKGTARYEGFYGTMPQAASGGFVGEKQVATAQDIAAAKQKTTQGLDDALQSGISGGIPDGFKVLDGASSMTITKMTVNSNTDSSGNFSVFGEATLRSIGFKEDDLNSLVKDLMVRDNPNMDFRNLSTDFQNVKADFAAGQLTFALNASSTIGPAFSENDLKSAIAGKPLNEAKASVLSLSGLTNAKISLWPFWLGSLPKNAAHIKVSWN